MNQTTTSTFDGTITEGGELTHSYSLESFGELKMTRQEFVEMIERPGFDDCEKRYGI